MKKYNIVAETNGYIANRDATFNGKTKVIIESNLSLKDAQKELLDMYNNKFEDMRPYARNWGLAVIQSSKEVDGAVSTFPDGTRTFNFDSRSYGIEEAEIE